MENRNLLDNSKFNTLLGIEITTPRDAVEIVSTVQNGRAQTMPGFPFWPDTQTESLVNSNPCMKIKQNYWRLTVLNEINAAQNFFKDMGGLSLH